MRTVFVLLVVSAITLSWSESPQKSVTPNQKLDGKWWSTVDSEERAGFINGVADCMTWSAHEKGFNATPEQLVNKITEFYKSHPASADTAIIDVWRQIIQNSPSSAHAVRRGETWNNPHWYLDGFWWRDASTDERLGFLEGYLWCSRTYVNSPSEKYSKTVNYYANKIDAFVKNNGTSKANREAVAVVLQRYRDQDASSDSK